MSPEARLPSELPGPGGGGLWWATQGWRGHVGCPLYRASTLGFQPAGACEGGWAGLLSGDSCFLGPAGADVSLAAWCSSRRPGL